MAPHTVGAIDGDVMDQRTVCVGCPLDSINGCNDCAHVLAAVLGEPRLQRDEAGAGFAGLHLRDERGLVWAVGVDVEIVTRAAEAGGTGKRVSLRFDADAYVLDNNLALNAVAFSSVPSAASIAANGRWGYIGHVAILSAGFALQRSPAFSLPGAGPIG
jgi:hypothetical protein